MIVNTKHLIGLPVVTQGGVSVGKVSGFDFDTDTGRLAALRVKARGIVPGLLDQELAVAWSQVVEITKDGVLVQDGTVPLGGRALAARQSPTAGVHMAVRPAPFRGDAAAKDA